MMYVVGRYLNVSGLFERQSARLSEFLAARSNSEGRAILGTCGGSRGKLMEAP